MVLIGHAYGHRQGRGNKFAHFIDDIMLDYMVKETLKFTISYVDPKYGIWRIPGFKLRLFSLSELYKIVRKRLKSKVSWDTVIDHLELLVAEHILDKDPNPGRNNETFYRLTKIKFRDRMSLRAESLILADGSVAQHVKNRPLNRIPNYSLCIPNYYFHYFHLFPGFRIDFPKSYTAFL